MTSILRLLALVTFLIASTVAVASAHDGHDHGTPAASPQASPAPGTGTGAVYLTIRNTGDTADTLLSGTTSAARSVEIHTMEIADGVMSMMELEDGLEIPAQGETVLEPGGYHVMLIDLQHDLNPDSTFDLTLTFANAGEVSVTVVVQTEAPIDSVAGTLGNLELLNVWSRPAPMLDA